MALLLPHQKLHQKTSATLSRSRRILDCAVVSHTLSRSHSQNGVQNPRVSPLWYRLSLAAVAPLSPLQDAHDALAHKFHCCLYTLPVWRLLRGFLWTTSWANNGRHGLLSPPPHFSLKWHELQCNSSTACSPRRIWCGQFPVWNAKPVITLSDPYIEDAAVIFTSWSQLQLFFKSLSELLPTLDDWIWPHSPMRILRYLFPFPPLRVIMVEVPQKIL